jgi:hypothetical protein
MHQAKFTLSWFGLGSRPSLYLDHKVVEVDLSQQPSDRVAIGTSQMGTTAATSPTAERITISVYAMAIPAIEYSPSSAALGQHT